MTEAFFVGEGSHETAKAGPESTPYYIPATSSFLERRHLTLKQGDTFGVFDQYGDVVSRGGNPEGLFHKDTRYLSDLSVRVNGLRPLLLSSTVQENNVLLTADLTNPDFFSGGHVDLARDRIHITRSKFLWEGACHERLGVRNFDERARAIEFSFRYAADFADIFELRGHARERRGKIQTEPFANGVTFAYHGLDGIVRRAVIRFEPTPARLEEGIARFLFEMQPHERTSVFMAISCEEDLPEPRPIRHFFVGLRNARKELRAEASRAASIETSNDIFNEALCQSVADLYMLMTETM